MSTGKIIAIAAVVIFLLMGIVGACLFSGGDSSDSPAATPVTAVDRLTYLEDLYADLARQMQTLQQQNQDLQEQNGKLQSMVNTLQRQIEQLERQR